MATKTITSANSRFTLSIPDVFPAPVALQGYAADDAFDNEAVDAAEILIGVDGLMSAGYTPFLTKMTIAFQANSPSIDVIDTWLGAMKSATEILYAQGSIELPSVGRAYTLVDGVLSRPKQIVGAKKVLQPVTHEITWAGIIPTVI